MANNDQGDLLYARGFFSDAIKAYSKNLHFCAISDHTLEMHMNCIKCGLQLSNLGQVASYLPKALQAMSDDDHMYVRPLQPPCNPARVLLCWPVVPTKQL